MSRLPLILALAAGVTMAGREARAEPVTTPDVAAAASTTSTKRASKTKTTAKSKKSKKSKKQRAKKSKPKLAKTNMPRGFTWPPSRTMRDATRRCEAQLTKLGVAWKRTSREGRIAGAIVVPSMRLGGVQYISHYRPAPHKMDCHLALVLAQVGPKLRELGVRDVKFGSVFRWSNVRVNGTTKPFLSRHALGIAMDIVSFVDDTGRTAVVASDYQQGDELLLAVEQAINASGQFRTVLTPQNDPASHDDHFHLEVAVDYSSGR